MECISSRILSEKVSDWGALEHLLVLEGQVAVLLWLHIRRNMVAEAGVLGMEVIFHQAIFDRCTMDLLAQLKQLVAEFLFHVILIRHLVR
jgi:hypothetical protein